MSNHTPIQLPLAIHGLTVEIPLTKGYVAIVDAVDADLTNYQWHVALPDGRPYAVCSPRVINANCPYVYMHRVILSRKLGCLLRRSELADHRDGNGLNNSRSNVRLATTWDNSRNIGLQRNNTSGYTGVSFDKQSGKWRASITVNYKSICLGYFADIADAVACRKKAEIMHFGEFSPSLSRPEL